MGDAPDTVTKVSVITPSLNPGTRLERCLQSVRSQTYPCVEHVIVDGGSDDGSLSILRRTEGIVYVSEPDRGQAHAINKGFALASGSIIGWLNADDELCPRTVQTIVDVFESQRDVDWVYGDIDIVDRGRVSRFRAPEPVLDSLIGSSIPQPGSFMRRATLDRVGPLDESLNLAMDLDLWVRLFTEGARGFRIPTIVARFELHPDSKSATISTLDWTMECAAVFLKHGLPFHLHRTMTSWARVGIPDDARKLLMRGEYSAAARTARLALETKKFRPREDLSLMLTAFLPRAARWMREIRTRDNG